MMHFVVFSIKQNLLGNFDPEKILQKKIEIVTKNLIYTYAESNFLPTAVVLFYCCALIEILHDAERARTPFVGSEFQREGCSEHNGRFRDSSERSEGEQDSL